jgi:hypothetical protein
MLRLALLAAALFVVGCGDGGGTPNPGDDGGTGDGGVVDGAPDDGATADGAPADGPGNPDGGAGTVCGTATCSATQECCVGVGGRECVDQGTCQDVALTCDGPEDCTGGDVCCAAGNGGGGGAPGTGGTSCRPDNQCQTRVCAAETDCDGGDMCCPIQELGVSLCLASCP